MFFTLGEHCVKRKLGGGFKTFWQVLASTGIVGKIAGNAR